MTSFCAAIGVAEAAVVVLLKSYSVVPTNVALAEPTAPRYASSKVNLAAVPAVATDVAREKIVFVATTVP